MNEQEKVKKFCKKYNLNHSLETRMIDLVSELGEVSKEVLKMTDYGKKKLKYRKEFEEELGDVYYSLITVANTFNVDLNKSLEKVLAKYEKRIKHHKTLSSN